VSTAQPNLKNSLLNSPKIFLPLVLKSRGSVYYIDSNNGSDSNSGIQPDQPWKSLTKLNSANLVPGAIVYLKRGSFWTEKLLLYASGQAGMPITITTYGSGVAPIISNPGKANNKESTVTLYGSFIIIDNIQIQESGTGIAIDPRSSHNIIQNNEIKNAGIGIVISGQYNLITHNYIHDLHMVVNTPGGGDDYGAIGVDILNAHNEVSFNRFVNCEAPSYDFGMDGGAVEIYQIGDYTSIHHNWSLQSAGFMEVSSNGTGSATNVRIFYNVIINATKFTVIHISGENAIQIQNFRVENNTLIDLRTHSPLIGSYIDFLGTPLPDTYIFQNNIIDISDYYWVSTFQFTHQNNLYYFLNSMTNLGYTLGPGELLKTDPQFIDLANYDFHLMSTSPAINTGINLGNTEDFDQNPVPINNVPDLGAFEYQGN
jgi:parallel beta-helix repeat protein